MERLEDLFGMPKGPESMVTRELTPDDYHWLMYEWQNGKMTTNPVELSGPTSKTDAENYA